uniref:Uncharacterized protein n=1 Tax=Pithovirus LCPAC001 TaxID=2506585 RepID=A0A481Z3P9_9VIRU|nr:MAG: hypothetical protein LCPAC001_01810 [Pithovirus LCPAC001]
MSNSYHIFYSQHKGKKTRDEINSLWKQYKARTESKTSMPGKRVVTPVKKVSPVRKRTPVKKVISEKKISFVGKNLPMSPTRRTIPTIVQKKIVIEPVVTITLDAPLALKIVTMLSLGKLYQIMQASPNLKDLLSTNVKFWANIYLKNFGVTPNYRRMARSAVAKEWIDLVRKTYLLRLR